MMTFNNSQHAFEFIYDYIIHQGKESAGTKQIKNCGFYILNPLEREIKTEWRKWSQNYAEYEWQWYLSQDRNADEIAKKAKIWRHMQDQDGNVNSNYGWQWNRNGQLDKVIAKLKSNPTTRQAVLSIYDGKEIDQYTYDTPCTLAITFDIDDNKLNMSVMMRSNDLVYGFCNDQYCFSKLQEMVSNELGLDVGTYFHFTNNMHIYEMHYKLKNQNEKI